MYKRYLYYRDTANTENIGFVGKDGRVHITERKKEREDRESKKKKRKSERERETSRRLHILFPPNALKC